LTFGRGYQGRRAFIALIPDCSSGSVSTVAIDDGVQGGDLSQDEYRSVSRGEEIAEVYCHVGAILVEEGIADEGGGSWYFIRIWRSSAISECL